MLFGGKEPEKFDGINASVGFNIHVIAVSVDIFEK
jgi:hypothetical protein